MSPSSLLSKFAGLTILTAGISGCSPSPCDLEDPGVLLGSGAVLVVYEDEDGDQWGARTQVVCDEDGQAEAPAGAAFRGGDCDDLDPQNSPGQTEMCDGKDNDCSGAPDEDELDQDGDSVRRCEGDCDDGDGERFPGAEEVCDGKDNNCDGSPEVDEGDGDSDGVRGCEGDCDDGDPQRSPDAEEVCDGKDNDCDEVLGGGEEDADSDGVLRCEGDCDDLDPLRSPSLAEGCDGVDNDCDGEVDEGLAAATWYPDGDADGYGDGTSGVTTCDGPPPGYLADAQDCNDENGSIHPGMAESCNGFDDDCSGAVDDNIPYQEWYPDGDGDGYGDGTLGVSTCYGAPGGYLADGTDCDDSDSGIHPDQEESCNGWDDDCDGSTAESVWEVSGRSFLACPRSTTWEDAQAGCQALGEGWALASLGGTEEQEGMTEVLLGEGYGDSWFGLHDRDGECSFQWVNGASLTCSMVTDGGSVCHLEEGSGCDPYSFWENGFPFDGSDALDCGVLLSGSLTDADGDGSPEPYHWGISGCTTLLPFVCAEEG